VVIVRKVEEMDRMGSSRGASPAEAGRDDWSWMVDEDPVFYLEDREAAR
jgi:hypothetical protein